MHKLAEIITDRKGLTWTALTALFYALVRDPFNQNQWNSGGIPLSPAAVMPVVFGIPGSGALKGQSVPVFGNWCSEKDITSLMERIPVSQSMVCPGA